MLDSLLNNAGTDGTRQMAECRAVVGIGHSADGIAALQEMLRAAQPGAGIGYIVQPDLDSHHAAALPRMLADACPLPVRAARDGMGLAPDEVLIIPPGMVATLRRGRLVLAPDRRADRMSRQTDALFTSLALCCGERAIGVVLSGIGRDGTLGARAIKEHGGLVVACGPAGAGAAEAPTPGGTAASGLIDLVLPAQDIPVALSQYAGSFEQLAALGADAARGAEEATRIAAARQSICTALRRALGHDFSGYKERSFLRRVQRRMQVLRIGAIESYAERLHGDPDEARALLRDLLISVTTFFRDADAFAALAARVVPQLFDGKGADDAVRVWVPGCATGEEVYSIAMLLREHLGKLSQAAPRLQLFGTDIDEAALQVARAGHYPAAQLEQLGATRLARFFERDGAGWTVRREVREMCVFSAHNLIRDPPFSRIDLVSCRNLLIYLDAATQHELFPRFHFALRPGGILFLGAAESASQFGDLFRPLDKHHRLYQRRDQLPPRLRPLPLPARNGLRSAPRAAKSPPADPARAVRSAAEAAVIERFAPPHVVVNHEGDIIHFSARTGRFLQAAQGQPTRSLLALARRGLRLDLRTALHEAMRTRRVVRRSSLDAEQVGVPGPVSLSVEPLRDTDPAEPLFLIVFETEHRAGAALPAALDVSGAAAIAAAQREVRDAHERLQTLIEEYETTVEELRTSNEELVSVNEELQSANEELETAQEEQQSVNEELQTVNQELHGKVEVRNPVHVGRPFRNEVGR